MQNMLGSKNKIRIHMQIAAHERHLVNSLTLHGEKACSSLTEIPIILPPLEIMNDCHIHEDKWYIVMLSGLCTETAAFQLYSS